MCERCMYLVDDFPITHFGEPHLQCLRPDGHDGEHVVLNERGRFYAWEPDFGCGCEEEDCGCIIYGELSEAEAAAMLKPSIEGQNVGQPRPTSEPTISDAA